LLTGLLACVSAEVYAKLPFQRGGSPTGAAPLSDAELLSVWTGIPTVDGAMLSTRLLGGPGEEGHVSILSATDSNLTTNVVWHGTIASTDRIARHTLTGLSADTQYYYAVALDGVPSATVRGMFKTLPSSSSFSFRFAAGGCAQTGADHPIFNTVQSFGGRPLFFANIGDFNYSDYNGTVDETRQTNYDLVFASATQASLYSNVPTFYTWDDHDFCGDASHGTSAGRDSAARAYRARVPTVPVLTGTTDAIYYACQIGRVRLLFTDQRSMMSTPASTDNSSKTKLGTVQKQWFKEQLDQSNPANQGIYYMLMSSVPWTAGIGVGDTWGAYSTERAELADHMKAQGLEGRVAAICGDQHSLSIDTGANGDYAAGGGMDIPVFQVNGIHQTASNKGGPYDLGTFTSGRVFGNIEVIDTGAPTITIRFYAVSTDSSGNPTVRLDANSDGISHEFTSATL
jgi:alkaline phosphatase D